MALPYWCGSFGSGDGDGDTSANGGRARRHLKIVPAPDRGAADATIVERLRAGDLDAFKEIFDSYYPALRRFVYRWTGNIAVAEDIAQDVIADLWHRRESLVVHASFRSYLFAAAHHRVRDVRAHDAVIERHVSTHTEHIHAMTPAADAPLLADELIRIAERRIDAFPPRMRAIYRLSRDAGLSYQEIATELGISVNTVYVQMGRALAALKDVLGDWGTPSA